MRAAGFFSATATTKIAPTGRIPDFCGELLSPLL
jgi:hypothetical protein